MSRKTVLVVMKEIGARILFRIILERHDAEVVTVETVEQAQTELEELVPHIIISDDEVEDGTIHDICQLCHAGMRLKSTVIVVRTDNQYPDNIQQLKTIGVVEFMVKTTYSWPHDRLLNRLLQS